MYIVTEHASHTREKSRYIKCFNIPNIPVSIGFRRTSWVQSNLRLPSGRPALLIPLGTLTFPLYFLLSFSLLFSARSPAPSLLFSRHYLGWNVRALITKRPCLTDAGVTLTARLIGKVSSATPGLRPCRVYFLWELRGVWSDYEFLGCLWCRNSRLSA